MIRIQDGEFLDLLPSYFKEQADIIALSYAYKMAVQKMLRMAAGARLYADVGEQKEEILDLMAIELNIAHYDMDMALEVKRKVIKDAFYLKMQAGTKGALKRLIQTIYPDSDIIEWFDYPDCKDGEIGTFDVVTSEEPGQNSYDKILKLISQTKSASASLRKVEYLREIPVVPVSLGFAVSQYSECDLPVSDEDMGFFLLIEYGNAISQYSECVLPLDDEENIHLLLGQARILSQYLETAIPAIAGGG